jgi:hypothetical protein
LDEAEIVQRMAFIAHDEASEVPEPSEEAFDLPPPLVATQWAAILGLGLLAVPAMWSDHLDAQLGQVFIQWIGVIGAVAD